MHVRSQEQLHIETMANEGATISEMLYWLVNDRKRAKKLPETLEIAGLSKNACRRFADGEGSMSLATAEIFAEACGYRITMEAKK